MADESWQAAVQRHLFSALVLGMLLASFGRVLGTFGIEKTRRSQATMLPQSDPDGDPWEPKSHKNPAQNWSPKQTKTKQNLNQGKIALMSALKTTFGGTP